MERFVLALVAVLCACGEAPSATGPEPAFKRTSSLVTVSAPTQEVTLVFGDGQSAAATFRARFYASTSPGPTAQMDGAILVVSAADGPMPQIRGESLGVEVSRATINSAGVIQFEGTGTVSTGRVALYRLPITGSARPAGGSPDDLIIDIVGGDVWEVQLEAQVRIKA